MRSAAGVRPSPRGRRPSRVGIGDRRSGDGALDGRLTNDGIARPPAYDGKRNPRTPHAPVGEHPSARSCSTRGTRGASVAFSLGKIETDLSGEVVEPVSPVPAAEVFFRRVPVPARKHRQRGRTHRRRHGPAGDRRSCRRHLRLLVRTNLHRGPGREPGTVTGVGSRSPAPVHHGSRGSEPGQSVQEARSSKCPGVLGYAEPVPWSLMSSW
jgi:hypothetical protein